jgi:hypothetical protein
VASLLPRLLFQVRTFTKVEGQCAAFHGKLASKNQPEAKRNETSVAATLYFKMADMVKADALSRRPAPRLPMFSCSALQSSLMLMRTASSLSPYS